jgi:PDZ domain
VTQQTFTHPRISRETRRLLFAVLMAVVALWLLARVRFTDGTTPENPVQPLLGQLAARPTFADLAAETSRVQARLQPLLTVVDAPPTLAAPRPRAVAALRIDGTSAAALLSPAGRGEPEDLDIMAADNASGLTLLKTAGSEATATPAFWTPARPEDPRYLWATTASATGVALRPVFIPSLAPATHPAWSGQLWKTAASTGLEPGAFLFTTTGDLAGLVIDDAGDVTIVSGDALMLDVARLRESPPGARGYLGVEVQPLSRPLASLTGSTGGVVVNWVDPQGPAADMLDVGDVIEEADGARLTAQTWAVREARLGPGEMLTLRIRRQGEVHAAVLIATPAPSLSDTESLGLTMRALPGVGAEVVQVVPTAAAGRSGLEAGDVITRIGETAAPTPAQVRAAFAADSEGRGTLLALTRGTTHRVAVLQR